MKSMEYTASLKKELSTALTTRGKNKKSILVKRVFDLLVTGCAGFFAVPLVLISAAAIKIFSPGAAFFAHERIGYQGKPIKVWKLRTMYLDSAERLQQHLSTDSAAKAEWQQSFKLKDDPRIIPGIGHLLRKSSMDELPQLWNVLKGEMSIVGPRPFPKYHLDALDII